MDIPSHPTRKPPVPIYRPPVVPCVLIDGNHDGEVITKVDVDAPETVRDLLTAIKRLIKTYKDRS